MLPQLVLYEMNAWDHVIAVVICIFAPILAFTSRRITTEDIQLEPEDKIKLYHSNGLLLFVFALVVVTLWRIPGRTLSGLGFAWPEWNLIVVLLLLVVILFYGLDIFFQYGLKKWRIKAKERRHATLAFVPADMNELVHFSFLALAAGVGEEVIFRGYLIHYIVFWTGNEPTGILFACLFSSALFAFLHGYQGIVSMIKIFFLALVFAALFVYSQSLILVIIIHTLIDFLSGWLGIYLLRYINQEENTQ